MVARALSASASAFAWAAAVCDCFRWYSRDDKSAAKAVGADWEALAWARQLQPLQQIEVDNEEEGWMDYEGD